MARSRVSRYGTGKSTQIHFGNVLANFDKLFAATIVKRVIFGCSCRVFRFWTGISTRAACGVIELEQSFLLISLTHHFCATVERPSLAAMAAPPSAYKDRQFLAVIGDEVR